MTKNRDVDMETTELDVVTGAFGYTGRYIARQLLSMGRKVRTLTGRPPHQSPFPNDVDVVPFNFDNRGELVRNLRGATTLYNTYWVRFPHGEVTFERAIENTNVLINAAREAGIRKIVHLSVSNASENSSLPYFKGKGILEKAIIHSGLSYTIVRPTLIFGVEDILINNIAWFLRRFPIFAVPGSGNYKTQPISAGDVAEIAVSAASENNNVIIDATGPEIYTFNRLAKLIAEKIGSRAKIVHVEPSLALFCCRLVGCVVNDVVLTRNEVKGLMSNLLISNKPPTGKTRFDDWLDQNASAIGRRYTSELSRHFR